jgi:hypothetical protein
MARQGVGKGGAAEILDPDQDIALERDRSRRQPGKDLARRIR